MNRKIVETSSGQLSAMAILRQVRLHLFRRREEASGDCDGTKAGSLAASVVGKRRSLRTVAQQQPGSVAGSGIKSKPFFEWKSKSPKPSSGDCVNGLAQLPSQRWKEVD